MYADVMGFKGVNFTKTRSSPIRKGTGCASKHFGSLEGLLPMDKLGGGLKYFGYFHPFTWGR